MTMDGDDFILDSKICEEILKPRPVSISRGRNFVHVACGKYHLIAIVKARDASTSVWAIGRNDQGQLGIGDTIARNRLTRIVRLNGKNITSSSCGAFHSVCVSEDGSMWVFGSGNDGALGSMEKEKCKAIGDYKELYPIQIKIPNEHIVEVACGDNHTLVRTKSNKVFSMGCGCFGMLGHGDEEDCFLPKEIDLHKSGFDEVTVHSIHAGSHHSSIICSVYTFNKLDDPGSVYNDDDYSGGGNIGVDLDQIRTQESFEALDFYECDSSFILSRTFTPDPQFAAFGWF